MTLNQIIDLSLEIYMNKKVWWGSVGVVVAICLWMWFFSWHPIQTWNLSGSSNSVAISSNGQLLATSSGPMIQRKSKTGGYIYDGTSNLEIRNLSDGSILHKLDFFQSNPLAFSPNNSLIAGGNQIGEILVWDTQNGLPVYSLNPSPIDNTFPGIYNLNFSPDGQTLISGIRGKVDVWNAANGQYRYSILNEGQYSMSPDGQFLAIGNTQHPIALYRLSDGIRIRQLEVSGDPDVFSPDGRLLAIFNYDFTREDYRGRIVLYRLQDNKIVGQLPSRFNMGFSDFAFSPDGKYLAVTYTSGGSVSSDIFGTYGSATPLRWHLDLWRVVRFWNWYYFQPVKKISSTKDSYSSLAFSPDGKILVASNVGKVHLWNLPPHKYWWLWFLVGSVLMAIGYRNRFYLLNRLNSFF